MYRSKEVRHWMHKSSNFEAGQRKLGSGKLGSGKLGSGKLGS